MGGPLNNLYHWTLDKRVLNKLKGTGFDTLRGFNKFLGLNIPLIKVLIKRYDADTRSFKLGSAKNPFNIAFGLEDVLYITGLPIDGKAVTGVDPKDTKSICQRYLGKHEGYGRDSDINLSWLKENFMTLQGDDENLSDEELGYHVRAYVLYAIGCTFSPGNNNMVRAMFLPLLENVDDIGSYAWGAAFLATIHDSIEKNSTRHYLGLYFPLIIFAYIRFPGLSSTIEIDRTAINTFPLAVSWSHALCLVMKQQFKNHNEEMLETFFDNLKEDEEEVKWQPYGELSCNFLPQHLREQVVLSKSRTILICFEKAVYHRPDKCQRQLGLAGHILKGQLIQIKTQSRVGKKGYDWSKNGKYVDYMSEWDKRFDLLIDRDANASRDQAKASDHTDGVENVAPIAEAGSANDYDASLVETVAVLDNQDPERDSRFEEEARRTEASLIAEPRKENGKSKEEIDNRKNFPEHVNRLSRIDNVYFRRRRIDNVDHQSPGDTNSSRVRNSTEIRSCHPQVEAAGNTSACVTANEFFSLNIENTVSNTATLPPQTPEEEVSQLPLIEDVVTDIPVPGYKELVTVDTEAGLSTRKKSKKRKKTSCGGSDFPISWEDLSCEELAVKDWKKLKQVDSTNKELQQHIVTLQSAIQALQAEKQKLEASHSQKDQALVQLRKSHLALNDEVSTLKGQLKQKDETLDSHLRSAQEATKKAEEMVANLDQERAAAILKYKASPRFAEECRIVMAPLLPHGYTLGVNDAKAPDLDIGTLANCGQGDETEKRFKELADGQDILAMYRSSAQELANAAPPDQDNASDHQIDVLLEANAALDQDKSFDHLMDILFEATAAPDQAETSDHTNGDENVAPIVAEAGSVNDDKCCTEPFVADDASSEKTLVLLDNQDPEKDSCPFDEACRSDALLIAELRKENARLWEEVELYRLEHEHVNQISRIQESVAHLMENNLLNSRVDNVDGDHQSHAGDTTSSRVRNSTEIRSCHPQIEATSVKKQRVSPSTTTTAGVDRAEPLLIIKVESDSDSGESITDSFMDALVGRS